MLWAYATNNCWHEELFVRSIEVAKTMKLSPQNLANILWAFSRMQPHHPATCGTVLALLPRCTKQIYNFTPLQMTSTALAVAKVFGDYRNQMHPTEVLDFFAA